MKKESAENKRVEEMEELNDEALDKVAGGAQVMEGRGILGFTENAPDKMRTPEKKSVFSTKKNDDNI